VCTHSIEVNPTLDLERRLGKLFSERFSSSAEFFLPYFEINILHFKTIEQLLPSHTMQYNEGQPLWKSIVSAHITIKLYFTSSCLLSSSSLSMLMSLFSLLLLFLRNSFSSSYKKCVILQVSYIIQSMVGA
jgi:hypothetical protein